MRTFRIGSLVRRAVFFLILIVTATILGCAGIELPNPKEVLEEPLGSGPVKVGMTKQEVESLWGAPDEIGTVEDKERWKGAREVWTYKARYGALPVNTGYLSKTKKLYFDGDNLTTIGE